MSLFKKIPLIPYSTDNLQLPVALQPDWFTILEEIEKQMWKCFTAHKFSYPKDEKDVYLVPIKDYKTAKENNLQFLDFAVLYLTDIVRHVETIQSWNPDTGYPGCIVAYDHLISQFRPGKILGVDVSMGDPLFLWKECQVSPSNFPDDHFILMEPKV